MYDRIGRGDKTLVQERELARKDAKFGHGRRYSLVSQARQIQVLESQRKEPSKHASMTIDVALRPQNLSKRVRSLVKDGAQYSDFNIQK